MILLVLVLTLFPNLVQAQLWSDSLASNRGIDWSTAGATITDRTSVCDNIAAYTGTAATINTAIVNCSTGGGGVVELGAGSFTLSTGICLQSNVTLRGAGSNSTKLDVNGAATCGNNSYTGVIVFAGTTWYAADVAGRTTATWSAGYAKGTTVVTLSTVTGLDVGDILFLDQADDSTASRPDGIWNCDTAGVCSVEGSGADWFSDPDRQQIHPARVTAINGTNVTISPPIHMPNWSSGKTPKAYWYAGAPITNAGVEKLSVDYGTVDTAAGGVLMFENAYNNWVKGVRIVDGNPIDRRCFVCLFYASVNNTVRDSYIYGSRLRFAATLNYGTETRGASANLIENTIWEDVSFPFIQGVGTSGNVFAYNYTYSNWYTSGSGTWPDDCGSTINCVWMQPSARWHAQANNYTLYEGNDTNGFATDTLRGTSHFGTAFRNIFYGWEPYGGAPDANGKQQQTVPVNMYALSRYFALLGNVLGVSGIHTSYQCATASATDSCATYESVVYVLGYSGNGANTSPIDNDSRIKETLYRWGNYDIVTGAARWCGNSGNTGWVATCGSTSEVPTGDAYFPQSIPASESLPSSFYLNSKPSWFGSVAWPAIGPDVSGTVGAGNKAVKIPARVCFESMVDDANYSTQNVRQFDADSCYSAAGGGSMDVHNRSHDALLVSGR